MNPTPVPRPGLSGAILDLARKCVASLPSRYHVCLFSYIDIIHYLVYPVYSENTLNSLYDFCSSCVLSIINNSVILKEVAEMSASSAIRHRLSDIGMSQKQLATLVGISAQNLQNKLNRDNFSSKELVDICKVIGLKLTMVERNPGKYVIDYEE